MRNPIAVIQNAWNALRVPPANPQRGTYFFPGSNPAGIHVTHEKAFMSAAVWACIDVVASSLASSDWNVYSGVRAGDVKTAQPGDNLQFILNTRFNPEMTAQAGKRALSIAAVGYGNGFAEIERDMARRIVALWPISPDRCEIIRNEQGEMVCRVTQDTAGGTIDIPMSDIFHIAGPSLVGSAGDDMISRAIQTIARVIAVDQFAATYFGNNAQLGTVFIYDGSMGADQRAETLKGIQERYSGKKSHTPGLFEGKWTIHQSTNDAEKAQLIDAKNQLIEEVCRWFRVPPHKVAHLLRCMPADTLVSTPAGPKRIADVRPGDGVWCPTPRGPKLSRVLNHWDNGIREVLEIRTTNRTVRCTANHRLLVRRSHGRPLNPGETGGRNVDGVKERVVWSDEYVAAGDLRLGDTLVALEKLPDQGVTVAPNGRMLTVGFMEFCGLLMADGNLMYERGKPSQVSIARGDYANYIDTYKEIAVEHFVSYARGGGACLIVKPVHIYEVGRCTRFRSVLAAKELFDLGFSGTAFTKRVPGWIFGLSEELRLSFLRGFLDGDGTVDKKGRITFYSANRSLIEDIRHLCMSAGVPVTNVRSDVNSAASYGIVKTRMWRFTCSDPSANSRIGSHDGRYVQRFRDGKPFGRKGRAYPRFGGKASTPPGLGLSRICQIAVKPAEPVFDIEVEGEHCFFADGVASHNSTNNNIEHQGLEFSRDTLRPWIKQIEQEADYKLFPARGAQRFVEIDVDWASEGDFQSRMQGFSSGINAGIYSVNDVRRKLGENTIGKEGNGHLVQGAMMKLEDVGKNMLPQTVPAKKAVPGNDIAAAWLESVYGRIQRRFENRTKASGLDAASKDFEVYAKEQLAELGDSLNGLLDTAERLAVEVAASNITARDAAHRVFAKEMAA